ncbi:MAG TPA: MlaD family protein [Candidatus Dormibacteraeota bacterium]
MATTSPRLQLPRLPFGRRAEKPAAHAQMGAGGKRLVGLATALIAVVALVLAFSPSLLPWNQQFHLQLQATGFGEIDQRSWVEMNGAKVGQIAGLDPSSQHINLDIEPRYAKLLHADASASVQPHGLLGPKFVELYPGTTGVFAEGSTIPASRVHVAIDFDQVIDALQPDVRQSLQTLLVELGQGSQGRGQDVNAALAALGQSAQDLTTTTSTLAARDADISQLLVSAEQFNRDLQYAPISAQIADTDKAISGIAQVNGQLGDGIDQTAATLAHLDVVMSGNSQNLAYVLSRLPETVTRLKTVLAAGDVLLSGANAADTKDGYTYNSIQALMTAVMFTESAFAGKDAFGNFARVYAIVGACSPGVPSLGSTTAQAQSGAACAGRPQNASGGQAQAEAQAIPSSNLTDQQLIDLFLGSGGS